MISVIRIRNQQEATPGKINPTRSIVDELILLISNIRLEFLVIERLLALLVGGRAEGRAGCGRGGIDSVACVLAGDTFEGLFGLGGILRQPRQKNSQFKFLHDVGITTKKVGENLILIPQLILR